MASVLRVLMILALLAAALGANAVEQPMAPALSAPDAALERRVVHVAEQLRCLVCQNQTIADSQAQLALDLKKQVALQLKQGRSEQDVIDFMVQRYGDFVLYRPPLKAVTALLWFGPLLFLAAGVGALWLAVRRQAGREDNETTGVSI